MIGAGTMGAGIAVALANAGLPVGVIETSATAAEAGRRRVMDIDVRMLRSGRIDAAEHAERLARIEIVDGIDRLASCGLVIAAVLADMSATQDVLHGRSRCRARQATFARSNFQRGLAAGAGNRGLIRSAPKSELQPSFPSGRSGQFAHIE